MGIKLAEFKKIKIRKLPIGHQAGNTNSQFGTCWIHNLELVQNKKIKKEEIEKWLSEGWVKGRRLKIAHMAKR